MGDHPVRGPQAAAPNRPAALKQFEHLEHPEPSQLPEAVEETLDLADVRTMGEDDPARPQSQLGGGRRLPGLGKVEQHAVHVALLHPEIDVPALEYQVRRELAERVGDRSPRGLEELLAQLVADHQAIGPDGAQRRERQGAGAGSGLEHPSTRMQVGVDDDRAEVLRIDRLRLALAPSDLLRKSRAHSQQPRAHLRGDDHTLGPADQRVVVDDTRMKGVALALLEPDTVAPADLVHQQDQLAVVERTDQAGLRARMRQCQ